MIESYFQDDIAIKRTIKDSWGEPITTTQIDVRGRFEYKTKMVRDTTGNEVVSTGIVYLKEKVTHEDILRYDNSDYSILSIELHKSFDYEHNKVYVR